MLIAKGVPRCFVRVLCSMYCSQRLSVQWNDAISDMFPCGNGVRQGSSLSPFLFSVYIDGVLNNISKIDIGCRLFGTNWNCLAYADDIVLYAPSWRGLQALMNVLFNALTDIDMSINCSKTLCMVFSPRYKCNRFLNVIPKFHLGDVEINFCVKFRYLGHIICNTLEDKDDVMREICLLFFRCNRLCNKIFVFTKR